MTRVYFATNRQQNLTAPGGFGTTITPVGQISYGAIDVSGINLTVPDSGTLASMNAPVTQNGFSSDLFNEIKNQNKNILVFIHGFDSSFRDAVARAAFNQAWLAGSGHQAANMTILLFSWPSLGQLINDPTNNHQIAYATDQSSAGQSGGALAQFFSQIIPLKTHQKSVNNRLILLAHSMGNFTLGAALAPFFATVGNSLSEKLFDEIILAAADEANDSFYYPHATRFGLLEGLAPRISIYSNRRDVAMDLSYVVNGRIPLGFDGPKDIAAPGAYPYAGLTTSQLRSIDCTEVRDYLSYLPIDATHQYYRLSKTVRDDIVAVIAQDRVQPGRSQLCAHLF